MGFSHPCAALRAAGSPARSSTAALKAARSVALALARATPSSSSATPGGTRDVDRSAGADADDRMRPSDARSPSRRSVRSPSPSKSLRRLPPLMRGPTLLSDRFNVPDGCAVALRSRACDVFRAAVMRDRGSVSSVRSSSELRKDSFDVSVIAIAIAKRKGHDDRHRRRPRTEAKGTHLGAGGATDPTRTPTAPSLSYHAARYNNTERKNS